MPVSEKELSMREQLCMRLTCGVVVLQGAVLLTLWVTPTWTPPRIKLIELLWAWMHQPTFYPLAVLVAAGPVMTIAAWVGRGRHRLWLVVSWLVFAVIIVRSFGDRAEAMMRVLWWVITES